ncbi:hypothetical protein EV193_105126 [Herbihabitans rhizosphaerae]|uniref:AAA domain-containing protein n=1 Tax=Herbihabitans rhizosphaerae TaxID=1872711 RepID=A0A4Q7KNM2_9PSEU|nr:hypothetical protein [Herbihabitans rhizosphaerae]RZS37570.1 hypothetical protein EV193_105126 [Herbihabitans rhizosphaerae]
MPWYTLTGTPGAGKTAVLRLLEVRGHADAVYEPTVFFIRNQGFIAPTAARRISLEESLAFEQVHELTYRELGFTLLDVPAGSLDERVDLIESFTVAGRGARRSASGG